MGNFTTDGNGIQQLNITATGDAGIAISDNFETISALITTLNTAIATANTAISTLTTAVNGALKVANNLSDLASASAARTNLGLGSAATSNTSAFDAAGSAATAQAASLQKSSNLSDLASASTARTNLGLGSAATTASTAYDAAGTATSAVSTHAALTATHGITSEIVGESETQTLTNKTISGSANTLTNLPAGNLTGTLSLNTTGTAAGLSSTLAITSGGTGQTSASAAINALLPSQTGNSGKVLGSNGTSASWTTAGGGSSGSTGTVQLSNGSGGFSAATAVESTAPGQLVVGNASQQGQLALYGTNGNFISLQANDPSASVFFNLPQTLGTSGQVLQTDGGSPANLSWVTPGGGSGAPGGSSGQLQYNSSGSFAGDTATTDGSGNLTVTSVTGTSVTGTSIYSNSVNIQNSGGITFNGSSALISYGGGSLYFGVGTSGYNGALMGFPLSMNTYQLNMNTGGGSGGGTLQMDMGNINDANDITLFGTLALGSSASINVSGYLGFTGTGTYSNFTIINGIITAAS